MLKTLSPYPIARESSTLYIVPDVIVRTQNGVSTAHLNGSSQLRLRLRINDASSEADPSTRRVLLGEAKTFIQRIEARRATLQRLADAIVTRQQAYFEHGPAALRPMTLSQIAEELGLSVPTVSRAVSGKFIACSQGTVEMRSLFSAVSFSNQGSGAEEQGASEIQAMICKLIETEDPRVPLSGRNALRNASEAGCAHRPPHGRQVPHLRRHSLGSLPPQALTSPPLWYTERSFRFDGPTSPSDAS